MTLLRSHKFEENARCAVGEMYPFNFAANMTLDTITINPEEIKVFMNPPEEVEAKKPEEVAANPKKGQQKKG